MYTQKVMDHFLHPRNMGEMKNPDGVGTVGNPVCGDVMKLYIKVGKKDRKEYIKDIKFQTLGCGAAIATSSMVTELVKEKSLPEALRISFETVTQALGGLPPNKLHCSNLSAEGVKTAIEDYQQKQGSKGKV